MFARLLSADCPPHRREREKIAKIFQTEVIPMVARERGFRGVWFFLDKHSGKLMSITLYETEDDLRKAHEDIKEFRDGILNTLGCTHVSAESLEVLASRAS